MQDVIIRDGATEISADLAQSVERATEFRKASTAENTKRAYGAAWRDFSDWCQAKALESLPADPATVALYVSDRAADLKLSSIKIRIAAIAKAHKVAGLSFNSREPVLSEIVSGIARTKGSAVVKKDPATKEILRDAIRFYAAGDKVKAKRDRALLAVGFFAALRRSELVSINVEHIRETPDGLVLHIPRRKTDQEGAGTEIGLPHKDDAVICPVKAFKDYVEAAGITEGPLFRSVSKSDRLLDRRLTDLDVARIMKAAAQSAGYDPKTFSGHSLRSGFITTCATKGVPDHLIAMISGHKSMDTLRGYVRRVSLFKDNAGALI